MDNLETYTFDAQRERSQFMKNRSPTYRNLTSNNHQKMNNNGFSSNENCMPLQQNHGWNVIRPNNAGSQLNINNPKCTSSTSAFPSQKRSLDTQYDLAK